jgi:peptide/nickel transport system substrate-binding protein
MKQLSIVLCLAVIISLLAACGGGEPQVVKETVIVEQTVKETVIVEGTAQVVEKVVTEVVEKEVEKVVTATPAEEEEQEETFVIVGDPQSLEFLNVMYTQGGNSLLASKLAQRGLLWLDRDGNWVGEAAEEVPTVENGGIEGNSVTYHLREGLTFHDGSPLTADDFKATWEAIMSPDNTPITRTGYDKIESIETPDDLTLKVNFSEPYASWPILFDYVFPRQVIEENSPGLDESEAMREPVGIGPYKILEWRPGEYIEYEAFDGYWRGRPKIDKLIWRIIPSDEALVAALETGEADIARSTPSSFMPHLRELADQGILTLYPPLAGMGSERYHMNPETPVFQNRDVRLALQHAIDKQKIIDEVLEVPAQLPVPSEWNGNPYANTELVDYEYNPELSMQLLDEVGWKDEDGDGIREAHGVGYGDIADGTPLSFVHTTTTESQRRENVQLVVQQMLKDIGVDMQIENRRSSILFTTWDQGGGWAHGDYEMGGWSDSIRTPEPEASQRFLCSEVPSDENPGGAQWMRYCNPEVDELLLAQQTEFDPAKRRELLWQAQQLIHDDAYTIHLYRTLSDQAVNANLKNFENRPYVAFVGNIHELEW